MEIFSLGSKLYSGCIQPPVNSNSNDSHNFLETRGPKCISPCMALLHFRCLFIQPLKPKRQFQLNFWCCFCVSGASTVYLRFMTGTKAKTHLTAQTHTVLALACCRVNCYCLAKEVLRSQIPILICQNYSECICC